MHLELVGMRNQKSFYLQMVDKLRITRNRVLVIGDSPEKDISSAHALGIRTVRVKRGRFKDEPCEEADWNVGDLSTLPGIVNDVSTVLASPSA